MTNLFNNLADICGMVPETATPPRPRPRTPGTRAEQEAAWAALARAMGWPRHKSDRPEDSPSLAGRRGLRVVGGDS